MRPRLYYLVIISLLLWACQDLSYSSDIKKWRSERLEELNAPFSWTSSIGLYHMKNSIAYFGRTNQNDFILPIPSGPSSFGYLEKIDDGVIMRNFRNLGIKVDGIENSNVLLRDDRDSLGPSLCTYESLQWYVINRQGEYYLRVKDSLKADRQIIQEIPYFPIDKAYQVTATLIPASSQDTVVYTNELGQTYRVPGIGVLAFELGGKRYQLEVLENDEESYFVMFGDETNSNETYGGGRYLYPRKADDSGTTILDFNQAINPPCVFTPYATCPLPPANNKLPISIDAGEKYIKVY